MPVGIYVVPFKVTGRSVDFLSFLYYSMEVNILYLSYGRD